MLEPAAQPLLASAARAVGKLEDLGDPLPTPPRTSVVVVRGGGFYRHGRPLVAYDGFRHLPHRQIRQGGRVDPRCVRCKHGVSFQE